MSHLRDLFFHFQLHFHHNQSILFKLVFFFVHFSEYLLRFDDNTDEQSE